MLCALNMPHHLMLNCTAHLPGQAYSPLLPVTPTSASPRGLHIPLERMARICCLFLLTNWATFPDLQKMIHTKKLRIYSPWWMNGSEQQLNNFPMPLRILPEKKGIHEERRKQTHTQKAPHTLTYMMKNTWWTRTKYWRKTSELDKKAHDQDNL